MATEHPLPITVDKHDEGPDVLIRSYIALEEANLRRMWSSYDQKPQLEKPSALFVTEVKAKYLGMTENDPLYGATRLELTYTPRPEMQRLFDAMTRYNLNIVDYARGGACYHAGMRNKRLGRWRAHPRELNEALNFWRDADWHEIAGPMCVRMTERTLEQLQKNLATLVNTSNTEERVRLAVSDRLPTTGTGWDAPLNDRQSFGRSIIHHARYVENAVEEWMKGVIAMYEFWPEHAITIHAPSQFRGTRSGSRSDPECVSWVGNVVEMHSLVREINTTPTSALSNHALTPRNWNEQMWLEFQPPGWLSPLDRNAQAYIESLLAFPATTKHNAPIQAINLDFGWTSNPPSIRYDERTQLNVWDYTPEKVKFGADNIVTAGVMMEAQGVLFPAKWSGDMNTMRAYLTEVGWMIYLKLKRAGVQIISVTQVGDDISIRLRREDVVPAMGAIGQWSRVKGMHDEWQFILGTYVGHVDEDKVLAIVGPRVLKSVTSPQELFDLPKMTKDEIYTLRVPEDVQEQIRRYLANNPNSLVFEGTATEYSRYISQRYLEDKKQIAELGGVSQAWIEDLFPVQETVQRTIVQ